MTEFRGRERYARADDGAAIYRNRYERRTVKTTSAAIELERPRSAAPPSWGSRVRCSARASCARMRCKR